MEDKAKPVKMVIFNGPLSFSPNTLNNNIITYALAKRWEQQERTYADWYQLIQNVTQIANSLNILSKTPEFKLKKLAGNMKFFNTWNVEGDGSAFVDFQAKALFDSQANPPFRILEQSERFPVSSPPGYHKAVISDMDTDSQFKSKLFALQLIIKQNLSLALEPTSFVNIGPKYYRQYSDQTMGADWWAKGKLKVLSDKQVTYPNSVLDFFSKTARGQEINGISPKNNFQLRMNQFNYSQPSKLSFISGFVMQSEVQNHLSISYCRRIKLLDQAQGFGYAYLHQVVRQQSRGILIDLNSISFVYRNKLTKKFQFQKMQVWIKDCFESDSNGVATVVNFTLTNQQLFASCGFYYYDNVTLIDSKGSIKAEFTFPEEIYQDLKNDALKAGKQISYTNPFVLGWTEEQEYSFQIEERFRKTQFLYKNDANKQNIQAFYPYIDYKFKCSRFGKPIPAKDTQNMQIQLEIGLVPSAGDGTPGIDATGIKPYSDPDLDAVFIEALKDPQFKKKYQSQEVIRSKWYLNALPDMVELANHLKSRTNQGDNYNWYNSQKVYFAGQFYQSTQVKDNKVEQARKITVDIDQNGQGTFRVFLNQNITRKNNPRSLCNSRGNSIINSLCIESTIKPTIITFKGKEQIRTPTSEDSISGLYYESNPQFGPRAADWKNFVGPRMRVMGLLYPAMQKIIDLYNFKEIDLGSMKRAFDIQSQLHSRYMPSTREISSYEHRMMRRWLYEPYYDHFNASNLNYDDIFKRVYPQQKQIKSDFFTKKKVLRQLLKNSFAFELLTIPLYLTAMYGAPSSTIEKLIRGISHDQMKHLFIASNLLNAIRQQGCEAEENGPPYLDNKYVPNFPQRPIYAYQSDDPYIKDLYTFDILPFGQELILKFIAAQFPGETESLILSTETDQSETQLPQQVKEKINKVTEMIQKVNQEKAKNPNFSTVGEMYGQVTQLLWQLSDEEDSKSGKVLFSGNPIYQFTYPQLENMTEIYSLRTALNQIRLIVEEGQGSRLFSVESKLKKLSHFLKFIQVYVGCQVDEEKTNQRNDPYRSGYFKIYFKYDPNWIVIDSEKNSWKSEQGQNQYIRGIISKQQDGKTPGPDCDYTNNISANAFTNMYKKIMLEFHYIFNSRYSRFKLYLKNDKQLDLTEAECLTKFKTFKFRRMENAIGKMRNMSLLARYNVRLKDTPVFQLGSGNNQGKSVKPDFNIHVQFPED